MGSFPKSTLAFGPTEMLPLQSDRLSTPERSRPPQHAPSSRSILDLNSWMSRPISYSFISSSVRGAPDAVRRKRHLVSFYPETLQVKPPNVKDFIRSAPRARTHCRAFASWRSTADKI